MEVCIEQSVVTDLSLFFYEAITHVTRTAASAPKSVRDLFSLSLKNSPGQPHKYVMRTRIFSCSAPSRENKIHKNILLAIR